MANPIPFGQVVTAGSGATPTRITNNLSSPANRVACQSIMFQVRPANTGLLYIIHSPTNTPGDETTTRRNVVAILPAPASATQGPFASFTIGLPTLPGPLNAADFWIESGVTGDGCIATGTQG